MHTICIILANGALNCALGNASAVGPIRKLVLSVTVPMAVCVRVFGIPGSSCFGLSGDGGARGARDIYSIRFTWIRV